MYFDNSRQIAAFSTMCMMLLRDCRHERSISIEFVADRLNVTSSIWKKAEDISGEFDFNLFIRACDVMQVSPSRVIYISECYVGILRNRGWEVLYKRPQNIGRDDLFQIATAFWKTGVGRGCWRDFPVLDEPNLAAGMATPLFRYALDSAYQAQLDNPPPLNFDFSSALSNPDEHKFDANQTSHDIAS
ncbi:hypothetical protein [Sphingobium yanoikuyae]|uniref:hypothetical protein n=1 Tax=Sphingobium yanoikuyae TaxID=13690 RepID=UPI0022DD4F26|nr:hypothetical protein [Sphingobium yanoikuyae]WBQ16962.1 hypothetical protein PAE53_01800 [Sphingobium yanoikuyae]